MGVQRYKTRDNFLCTGTITEGEHAPMTGDDHDELVTGREDSDWIAWSSGDGYRFGKASATHRKRSYGYNLQDLPPLELSSHHNRLLGIIATIQESKF